MDVSWYYGIRLLITHPKISVDEVTAVLGMEPDYSWNAGERNFTEHMMWGHTSWTEGQRLFFDEVHEVLKWLNEERMFFSHFLASGGKMQVIVQLPGTLNTGDVLKLEAISLALELGVSIGVEVFPNLAKPGQSN